LNASPSWRGAIRAEALRVKLGDHRLTLLLCGLTLIVLAVMRGFFPSELAMPLPGSDIRPVLLLEFAGSADHLSHIFGHTGDPLRSARIEGMTIGNRLDYLLMPAYGLLTLSFFHGIAQETGQARWRLVGWLGIIAALSDAVENAIMFVMVDDFVAGSNPLGLMALLPVPVWVKFGLLAASCGLAAGAFLQLRQYVLALLCLPAAIMFVPGLLDPFGLGPAATTLIGLGWIAMAIHAASRWMGWPWPRLAS
jgi:hypothetical protein